MTHVESYSDGATRRDAEIAREQKRVDIAYAALDSLRQRYREHQRAAESSQWRNTPQALTERDAFAAHWGDEASRLEQVGDRLVFGRIDMSAGGSRYIGRIGLMDDEGEQVLIDWRAPAAQPFYQATGAYPQGVIRRRHIQTRSRTVTDIEDELLDVDHSSTDISFQGEGALMAALTRARDGRMSDIVSTIQAEQDEIIRRDLDGMLVIQGGPGTGKTAVALHRAAYLLYAERARLERSGVLVIGPSRVFLQYIDRVLPSLGETGVVSTTIGDLLPHVTASAHDSETVREIKGRLDWVSIAKAAVRSLERVPEDIPLAISSYRVVLRSQDVRQARTRARRSGKPHNEAWKNFALELMDSLAQQMNEQVSLKQDLTWYYDYIRGSKQARRAINLQWLPMSALALLERLYADPEFLRACAPSLTRAERELLWRPRGSALTDSDIPILDELEELLGELPTASAAAREREAQRAREIAAAGDAIESMGLGDGLVDAETLAARAAGGGPDLSLSERALRDRTWAYGHIIVDEAQELSQMAWHILMRRCPSRSFTVTGDLEQRSGAATDASWEDLLGPAKRAFAGEAVLTVSYRTPASVLNRAQNLMRFLGIRSRYPLVAARDSEDAYALTQCEPAELSQIVPRIIRTAVEAVNTLASEGEGRIAVIVPADDISRWDDELDAGHTLDDRIALMTPTQSKGLEFDIVIVVDPTRILTRSPGDLYVAMTRPTHQLHLVATGEVPAPLRG
ncbi:MAG: ATP-dependent DNA helicase [Actinomycetaceae bacterium]|nr:ATP-dependent DNA helicase [Actinomycetaceae bacterium]